MDTTNGNKVQVSLKIDSGLNRFMRARAAELDVSQSAVMQDALYGLAVRLEIEGHIRASIHGNLRFATDEEFRAYCNATGKTPMNAGRIITEDDFVLNEMYMFLLQWHRRGFSESYLAGFFEREYWRPAESLTPDAFEEQRKLADMLDGYAEESLARRMAPQVDADTIVRPLLARPKTRKARKVRKATA